MKDTYYFPHDYHARNNLKIDALLADHGPAGYGIFWMIIEILHENEDHSLRIINGSYKALAKQMSTSVEHIEAVLKSCIDYELLYEDENGIIRSDRVDKNIDARAEISKKRSKAGKVSAEKRLKATSVEQGSTGVEQVSTKERKGKYSIVYRYSKFYDYEIKKSEGKPYHDHYLKAIQLFHGEIGIVGRMEKILSIKKGLTYDQFVNLYELSKSHNMKLSDYFTAFDNYNGKYKPSTIYTSIHTWMKNDFEKQKK